MKKSKLINFVIFIATLLPATYISLPFINASGCNYNMQVESDTLFTRVLCNSGKIKTITNIKNSDVVVSQEFISAYRSPYLITILTDTDIIHHKNDSSEQRVQKSWFNPCAMSKINVYYVGHNNNGTFLIRKPLWGECKAQGATIYKTPIEGRFSHWE
ncbi:MULTISPECIES: hypothetical protein [Aeromonas]|nr:hypothetical protein [Aeromonas jandaei]